MMSQNIKTLLRSARRRYWHEPQLRAAAMRADAVLVSFPKSGRTWLRYLLSCYLAELAELGFQPDLATTFRVLPNFDRSPHRGVEGFVGKRPNLPLILVSHLPFDERLFLDRPVIFLVRDPRDVIVSAYFHATRHKRVFDGPVGAFLDDPTYGLPALISFTNGWAGALTTRRHLVRSYEALHSDTEEAVTGILHFLGVSVDDGALERAIALAQFDRMRKREQEQGIPDHEYDRADAQSLRMRSGKAQAFGDVLSPTEADHVLEACARGLTAHGRALLAATGVDLEDHGMLPRMEFQGEALCASAPS
ncbi:sulfotransferase domain-containing protein [Novosphingobium sp. M1R2S20]|uniref:Sulfotransferase domain-containing protein n=1 Tax=Novosphingobium rhizovicinum TaxID=3228928 RepID=A0ABV3RG25_9SPHN